MIPIRFHYVSLWKAVEGRSFALVGTIGAGPDTVQVYSEPGPIDATLLELQHDWEEIHQGRDPRDWLQKLAESGNGFTREFSEVHTMEAPSLEQALRKAYKATKRDNPSPIEFYQAVEGEVTDLGRTMEAPAPGGVSTKAAG